MISQPLGWATIFAAAAIALGLTILLHMFGIGVGLTAVEPNDPSSLRGVGVGTGIWTIIAPIIALFLAGLVAGRTAPTLNAWNAAIHGAAAWAVTTIVGVIMVAMMLGAMARGVATTAGAVGNIATAPLSMAGQVSNVPTLGIDMNDFVARLNQELEQQGMPPVKAENVEAALREAAQTAVRQGGIDRQQLVSIVAKHTALSQQDAEKLASQIETQLRGLQERGTGIAGQAGETALQAVESTGKVLLWLSIAMILGLGAAMGGAVIAVRRERRDNLVSTSPRTP